MKTVRLIHAVVAIGLGALCISRVSAQTDVQSPRDLINSLVATLNTRSEDKIRAFIQKWMLPTSPVNLRVQRWMALETQGGPFKIVADGKQSDGEIDTYIVDKDGTRLVFRLHIESKPNLQIEGLQIAPAFTVEGLAPGLDNWSNLSQLAAAIVKKSNSPGMGIAVVRNGATQIGVAGFRSIKGHDPVTSDDVWSIGSIGKAICTTVIGRLIEQHKLSWDETLRAALPGFPMNTQFEHVTLEQIMHHRGGIPADLGFRIAEVKRIVGTAKTAVDIRDRYVLDILSRKPIASPDERFVYSNAGYALLSHIAELVSGMSYEKLVKDLVFKSLGLNHSYTGVDTLPKARPSGHVMGPKGLVPEDMTGPMESMLAGAGGGMYMSVGDLAKFGQSHLNGLRGIDGFMKSATIKRLHRGLPEQTGGSRLYACGWGIETLPGLEPFHGHNGSNGTMRSQIAIFPASNLVVVAIVNRGGEDEPSPALQAVMAVGKRFDTKR